MTEDLEQTLDRVRKLLALATSSNPHEAAAAAGRAQALIDAHRLKPWLEAEAEGSPDPIVDDRDHPLDAASRVRPWRAALGATLARANGCVAYTLTVGGEQRLILVGRDGDRAAVRALWDWLLRRVEWLSATAGPGRSRKWHEAFRVGVVDAVAARLDDRAPVDVGGALVAVDAAVAARAAAVDRFVSENLGLSRGRGMRVDAGAYAAGQRAGQDLSLPGR